jgi:hypothetical protein
MGPEWKLLMDFGLLLASAIPKLIELFQHGGRDGVLVALDGALVVARAKTDADLHAKHAKRAEDDTVEVPLVPTLKR